MQNQQGVFPAPTDYWLVAAPVRARVIKIQADRLGQCEQLRRPVDCAPYPTLRLSVFALKMRTHEAMRPYRRRRHGHTTHAGPMCARLKMAGTPR